MSRCSSRDTIMAGTSSEMPSWVESGRVGYGTQLPKSTLVLNPQLVMRQNDPQIGNGRS